MKFCSAVLEEWRIRDWEGRTDGRTNERTDGHKDHYIPPQLRLRGYNKLLSDRATQFTIAPSQNRVWVDVVMTRWYNSAWRWCDVDCAMVWRAMGNEAMFYRSIVIASSHHRYRVVAPSRYRLFCTCAVWRKWRQDYIVVFSCYELSITNQTSCMLVLN